MKNISKSYTNFRFYLSFLYHFSVEQNLRDFTETFNTKNYGTVYEDLLQLLFILIYNSMS